MNNNTATYFKILAIFDFILAGFSLMYAFFWVIYMVMGFVMVSGDNLFQGMYPAYSSMDEDAFMAFMGVYIFIMSMVMMLLALAFTTCLVLLGIFTLKKKHHTFCLVMAAISTLIPVYGTILGSFTMILLAQPSGKDLFQRKTPPPLVPVIPS